MSVWTTTSSAGNGLESSNSQTRTPQTAKSQLSAAQRNSSNPTNAGQLIGSDITTSANAQQNHFQHVVAAAVAAATTIATGQHQQQQQQHHHHQQQLLQLQPFHNHSLYNQFGSSSGSSSNNGNNNNNNTFNFKRSSISNSAPQLPASSQNFTKAATAVVVVVVTVAVAVAAELIVEFEYHARRRRQFSNQRQRRRINGIASVAVSVSC
ncbi:uncharacterized protein Dmoj_GI19120, isoform B [Drosophila mojavensis]|uniref:Uncharacterized protein, isoform B n=1 Tax=Drosophila mojavensis TaxID=7230 RepID=A0A0Q9XHL6_DROMO|nr:uncharacterized protein Dmoj_GI19120, isoform B [Drosophila mojavensis]